MDYIFWRYQERRAAGNQNIKQDSKLISKKSVHEIVESMVSPSDETAWRYGGKLKSISCQKRKPFRVLSLTLYFSRGRFYSPSGCGDVYSFWPGFAVMER